VTFTPSTIKLSTGNPPFGLKVNRELSPLFTDTEPDGLMLPSIPMPP